MDAWLAEVLCTCSDNPNNQQCNAQGEQPTFLQWRRLDDARLGDSFSQTQHECIDEFVPCAPALVPLRTKCSSENPDIAKVIARIVIMEPLKNAIQSRQQSSRE